MIPTQPNSRLWQDAFGVWRKRGSSILVACVLWPIGVYRKIFSSLKRTPTCRFLPTCSEYAQVAIRQRGVMVGGALAVWRLLRCNPLFRGGYDPVPCSHDEKVHAGPR